MTTGPRSVSLRSERPFIGIAFSGVAPIRLVARGQAERRLLAGLRSGISGEELPRRVAIGRDLRLQLIQAGEFHFRPDEAQQGDAQMLAIEVLLRVEEMHFQLDPG